MSEVVDEDVNVLFIEDDPAVAEMYKLKLELDGYRVTVAKSGEDSAPPPRAIPAPAPAPTLGQRPWRRGHQPPPSPSASTRAKEQQ